MTLLTVLLGGLTIKSNASTASLKLHAQALNAPLSQLVTACHSLSPPSSLLKLVGDDKVQIELATGQQGQGLGVDVGIAKHALHRQLLGLHNTKGSADALVMAKQASNLEIADVECGIGVGAAYQQNATTTARKLHTPQSKTRRGRCLHGSQIYVRCAFSSPW